MKILSFGFYVIGVVFWYLSFTTFLRTLDSRKVQKKAHLGKTFQFFQFKNHIWSTLGSVFISNQYLPVGLLGVNTPIDEYWECSKRGSQISVYELHDQWSQVNAFRGYRRNVLKIAVYYRMTSELEAQSFIFLLDENQYMKTITSIIHRSIKIKIKKRANWFVRVEAALSKRWGRYRSKLGIHHV